MKEQQQKFELYLEEQIAACEQRSRLLTADDRMEEGNFEKIRANIYGIFKTVLSAAERACDKDADARKRFFLEKTEQIPANWEASYEKARRHGDFKKMHLESIKLDTIREIKNKYLQIEEEAI